jgi:hypothetical protein
MGQDLTRRSHVRLKTSKQLDHRLVGAFNHASILRQILEQSLQENKKILRHMVSIWPVNILTLIHITQVKPPAVP